MTKAYYTVQGDMWDSIAYKLYGDTKHTDTLICANMQHHRILVFSAGIRLDVPDVEQRRTNDDLPPWKKVSG